MSRHREPSWTLKWPILWKKTPKLDQASSQSSFFARGGKRARSRAYHCDIRKKRKENEPHPAFVAKGCIFVLYGLTLILGRLPVMILSSARKGLAAAQRLFCPQACDSLAGTCGWAMAMIGHVLLLRLGTRSKRNLDGVTRCLLLKKRDPIKLAASLWLSILAQEGCPPSNNHGS